MYNVETDKKKNRLYLTLGVIESGNGENIFKAVQSKAASLTTGFSFVVDISKFKVNASEESVWVQKVVSMLTDLGMGYSSRVTGIKSKPRKTIGRHGKTTIVVETIAKANRILDQIQNKIESR